MNAGRGMGRGLAAILSVTGDPAEDDIQLRDVPVELVVPNPKQPRRRFDEATLAGLAESVRQRGVLQPVLVRPVPGGTYELVAGERARRAPRTRGLHPDQVEAIGRISDALSAALGTEVRVRPSGTGFRAEVELSSADAALDLARRLRPRAVA